MTMNTNYNKLAIKRDIVSDIKSVSKLTTVSEIEKTMQDAGVDKATVVIWLMNRIVWTTYVSGHIELDDEASVIDYWQEMRAFNEQGELHLLRSGAYFYGRIVKDKEETADWAHGYVDSISPIWGENTGYENGKVHLEDADRKLNLEIPVSDGNAVKYGLVTRSYIHTDEETGLTGYGDYRYLAIEGMEGR